MKAHIPNVSAATITPPAKDVIALENHVISCVLGDIPAQVTGVTWDPATETSGEYNLLDGSESSNSQTSTLTITAAKLQSLDKLSSGVHTFTCSFTIGTTPVTVSATQTITIFNPSKQIICFNCWRSCIFDIIFAVVSRSTYPKFALRRYLRI